FNSVNNCQNTSARAGELKTGHGIVPTPVFCPVGSQATVKTLTSEEVKNLGFNMILCNNYHLYLRPGIDVVEELGGLHRFMNWDGAILTDSGGYQVFSLSPLIELSDEGVVFRSHLDGSRHFITPESATLFQEKLGADIIMVLDECAHIDADYAKVEKAMERTHLWAKRCLDAHKIPDQSLFAIVQGGVFTDLRRRSAEYLTSLDFPGYALGGLSLGEAKEVTYNIVDETVSLLPKDKPRYLMGVGAPEDIVEGVARGIDIFDCVLPTRVARNGALFTRSGRINITNSGYKKKEEPVDPSCDCYACKNHSAAYVHHLFDAKELLAYRLATIHNLRFMHNLMADIRKSILEGTFAYFKADFLNNYKPTNEEVRIEQKKKWIEARHPREG
ncbi:MAG: tRNA guanosine(34) transglycosylase Tgt, partial [Dehalococcoidales bacterium]|nr:tRNA guanosine(34) transglycosylase Tgt [Dehalococcoidales bacterium]